MKKWINPIAVELLGVIIFTSGVGFYFLYVKNIIHFNFERSLHSGESFSPEIIDKYIFYWNVSAVIMLIGGVFVFLGLLALGIKIFLTVIDSKNAIIARRFSLLQKLLLTVPFVILIVFHYLYGSVNENIVVKHFGCGCPKLDDRLAIFDANMFNTIVWGIVLFVSAIFWSKGLLRIYNKQARYWIALIGTLGLFMLFMRLFSHSFWL